jgi:uncharacterized protein
MIAIDTNILIYAHREDFPQHPAAKAALNALHMSQQNWAIPVVCIHEFLSVVTGFRAPYTPTPVAAAFMQVRGWMTSSTMTLLQPTDQHVDVLEKVVTQGQARGGQIHDARIAAICLEHGVRELWTADRDFARFAQLLPTRNPLDGG